MPAICTTSFVCSPPEIVRKVIRLSPRSPNLNAYAERFVRSIKDECLNRMIFVGQASLRRAVSEYMAHYHGERNHQGLDQPVNSAESEHVRPRRTRQPPRTARRNAQFLLPRSGVIVSTELLDTTGSRGASAFEALTQ